MKVILNYDPSTGYITDKAGILITSWQNLNCDEASSTPGAADPEQLIRIMKIAAHIQDPDKVVGL